MTYKSELSEAIHSLAEGLLEAGLIDDERMQEYSALCLQPPTPLTGEQIRAIREREHLTQARFALYLNVSRNHVSDWERGVKKPSGAALKLLSLVQAKGIVGIS